MMMKDRGKLVVWPAYLDKEKTKAEGRIISKKSAVQEPKPDEILKAAQKLGFEPEFESSKAYPRSWWEKSGRIMIVNAQPKTAAVRQIAAQIKKARGE
ncbi:signal recognition particle protein Srp19 [Methanolapillus millepedarum]|uniref:Signal recognition particle 19 kDa protein n=1 Tax=Methanolapillus millepedarum TaxID=3028296 RepID=A0AA96ZVS7_9EURY|nr:hypothetical protein MsAc7_13370 [Methanosarcinaceae archaeon Ac7]